MLTTNSEQQLSLPPEPPADAHHIVLLCEFCHSEALYSFKHSQTYQQVRTKWPTLRRARHIHCQTSVPPPPAWPWSLVLSFLDTFFVIIPYYMLMHEHRPTCTCSGDMLPQQCTCCLDLHVLFGAGRLTAPPTAFYCAPQYPDLVLSATLTQRCLLQAPTEFATITALKKAKTAGQAAVRRSGRTRQRAVAKATAAVGGSQAAPERTPALGLRARSTEAMASWLSKLRSSSSNKNSSTLATKASQQQLGRSTSMRDEVDRSGSGRKRAQQQQQQQAVSLSVSGGTAAAAAAAPTAAHHQPLPARRATLPAIHLLQPTCSVEEASAAVMRNPPVFDNPLRRRGCLNHQYSLQLTRYRSEALARDVAAKLAHGAVMASSPSVP